MDNLKRNLLFLVSVFVVVFVVTICFYKISINKTFSVNDSPIVFNIEKGDSVKTIASNLHDDDLISNEFLFYLYVRLNDYGSEIIADSFSLNSNMSIVEIVEVITSESVVHESKIVIQEGLTVEQIDEKLVTIGVIDSGDFKKAVVGFSDYDSYEFLNEVTVQGLVYPLEGYLYPDTYFINSTAFDVNDFIIMLLNNFEKRVVEQLGDNFEFSSGCVGGNYSFHECVIMASIIEREVFGEKDREIVSGIFWKRLDNNWTLGADATLLYLADDNNITASDLKKDSQYNTRKNLGLPLGPICNPSVSAITAALNPEKSDYWFYLTTLDTGEVIYAKTNDGHNVNRVKYLN